MQKNDVKKLTDNLPFIGIPNEFNNTDAYLRFLTAGGLAKRYQKEKTNEKDWEEIINRAEYELSVIIKYDLSNYFLIVADYVKWAMIQGIPTSPGRGASVSSIVAYALGITEIDPIKYNLLFERFINPDDIKMPDIDIDFGSEGRDDVIEYIKEKYGKENVGRISVFYKNKTDDGVHHAGIHAAGIVISKNKLQDVLPVKKDTITGDIVTQCDYTQLEEHGLVKFDLLSMKILDIIYRTEELIRLRGGELYDFIIDNIPENDPAAFAVFTEGDTDKVFQFESEGMKEILKQAKPDRMTDLIALNALYRPTLMKYIPQFIDNKNCKQKINFPHPCLEDILEETYGIIVYQEQIMQIAQRAAGYSLGDAAIFWRRLMKKINIDTEKEVFVMLAVQNKFIEEQACDLFELLLLSSGCSFNKSHAAAYAKLAYQTAYLKANFPKEYEEAYKNEKNYE